MEESFKGKYSSAHLVFNKIHFSNIKSLTDFLSTHKDILMNGIEEYIDMGIYNSTRSFRLPECTKKSKEKYPKIISENHDYQDALLNSMENDDIIIPTTKKHLERKSESFDVPTIESISEMEEEFLSHINKFMNEAIAEYNVWLSVGIRMRRAGFSLSTFIAFSKLDKIDLMKKILFKNGRLLQNMNLILLQ